MSEGSENSAIIQPNQTAAIAAAVTLPQDVARRNRKGRKPKKACAPAVTDSNPNISEGEVPPKRRRRRRLKSKNSKRRSYPLYSKESSSRSRRSSDMIVKSSDMIVKPDAPYNTNQFLIEDHGDLKELEDKPRCNDQTSTSTPARTRDSSCSVDSDAEFYSSPDDEQEYLIKDFDDQYESVQVERLQALSKGDLINEFLMLEDKMEGLAKRLRKNGDQVQEVEANIKQPLEGYITELQTEVNRLTLENERLRRENETLRKKLASVSCSNSSDSADSETDSSDSCSSSSSSTSSRSSRSSSHSLKSPIGPAKESVELTNGQAPTVDAV